MNRLVTGECLRPWPWWGNHGRPQEEEVEHLILTSNLLIHGTTAHFLGAVYMVPLTRDSMKCDVFLAIEISRSSCCNKIACYKLYEKLPSKSYHFRQNIPINTRSIRCSSGFNPWPFIVSCICEWSARNVHHIVCCSVRWWYQVLSCHKNNRWRKSSPIWSGWNRPMVSDMVLDMANGVAHEP
jgi:hypothetical protein